MECVMRAHTPVTLQMSLQVCREANDSAMHLIDTGRNGDRSESGVDRMKLRLRVILGLGIISSVILWLIYDKEAIYIRFILLANFLNEVLIKIIAFTLKDSEFIVYSDPSRPLL